MSKQLGITQARVSNFKVKKQLLYPYATFDWKQSFARVSQNAVYEDGKIKIQIPDRNLYLELKNEIEQAGGFVEVQLTSNLLQVRTEYFLDLMVSLVEGEDTKEKVRRELRTELKKQLREKNRDVDFLERGSFGQIIRRKAPELAVDLIGACMNAFGGGIVGEIAKNLWNTLR